MNTSVFAALVLAASCVAWPAHAEPVAARVNGSVLTETEVRDLSDKMAAAQGTAARDPASLRQDAIQELINTEILIQQAAAEHIETSPAEVDERLNEMKARYPTPQTFQQALASLHGSEADLRRDLGRSLVIEKLLARHIAVTLTPDAAEKFYQEHSDQFQHPAEVRASHILFRLPADGDTAKVRQRAEDALARLRQGEDFAKLARDLSEDTVSAANGGDLDFFSRDDTVPAFADAAFSQQPGQLSGIVQTQFGFHIIKVTDRLEAGLTPFAAVQPGIEEYLQEQEHDKQRRAYTEQLKQRATIEIVEPKTPESGKEQQ